MKSLSISGLFSKILPCVSFLRAEWASGFLAIIRVKLMAIAYEVFSVEEILAFNI